MELNDHPFSPENVARESGMPDQTERAWLRFVKECERLLGHDLDGNDTAGFDCGYSIDEAYDRWRAGSSAPGYVDEIKKRDRYDGGAFVCPASNRPGDMAAIYAEETGVDYATALVACNMD